MKQTLSFSHFARQLANSSFVGLCSNLLSCGDYLLLVANGLGPRPAVILLYFIGVLVCCLGDKCLTFRCTGGILSSGVRYLNVYIATYLINFSDCMVCRFPGLSSSVNTVYSDSPGGSCNVYCASGLHV